ncbi:hypothetical protein Hanom_Chr05g00461841 [Helianthus anomalus]
MGYKLKWFDYEKSIEMYKNLLNHFLNIFITLLLFNKLTCFDQLFSPYERTILSF